MGEKGYLYAVETTSLCPECMVSVPAKIIIKDGKVFLRKRCSKHGVQEALLEDVAEFWQGRYRFDKPGTLYSTQTAVEKGCPFDCGLCSDHEQHTCIGLIEVTAACNLTCPLCYANSGIEEKHLSVEKIGEMMDFFIASEDGHAEILQVSGGEPTVHPDIIPILRMAMEKNFKYVMLNSNGIRIAEDPEFVKALSEFQGGFEVYLQFDGFEAETYKRLRGRELTETKRKAVDALTAAGIPVTLVMTVQKGLNDHEVGKVLEFGLRTKGIRGVNYQPVTFFGRVAKKDALDRATMTGVLHSLEEQTGGLVKVSDFVPLPCNVERVAFTYLYKNGDAFLPITRRVDAQKYVPLIQNSFAFDLDDFKSLSGNLCGGACSCMDFVKDIRPLIPVKLLVSGKKQQQREFLDESVFRITSTSFIDAYNFDLKSMRKECVHFITPDLKKIPFSAFNMVHRGEGCGF